MQATVLVDGKHFTGKVYHTRDNGWPCVTTTDGTNASGPRVTLPVPFRNNRRAWLALMRDIRPRGY